MFRARFNFVGQNVVVGDPDRDLVRVLPGQAAEESLILLVAGSQSDQIGALPNKRPGYLGNQIGSFLCCKTRHDAKSAADPGSPRATEIPSAGLSCTCACR